MPVRLLSLTQDDPDVGGDLLLGVYSAFVGAGLYDTLTQRTSLRGRLVYLAAAVAGLVFWLGRRHKLRSQKVSRPGGGRGHHA